MRVVSLARDGLNAREHPVVKRGHHFNNAQSTRAESISIPSTRESESAEPAAW